MLPKNPLQWLRLLGASIWLAGSLATVVEGAEGLAEFLVRTLETDRGMCLHLGDENGILTAELAKSTRLTVQGCTWNLGSVAASRATIAAAGCGDRASTIAIEGDGLPYADALVNRVVWSSLGERQISFEEILRVLVPGGIAILGNDARPQAAAAAEASIRRAGAVELQATQRPGWLQFKKPVDPGFDGWSHRLGGADLSSVNADQHVAPWSEVRWIGDPRWGSLYISYLGRVTDGGRLYYKENRAASSATTQSWLVARDAYNGFELWREPAGKAWERSFYSQDDTLCCDAEAVYVVEDGVLRSRAGRTGQVLRDFDAGFVPTTVTSTPRALIASSKSQAAALEKSTGRVLWSRAAKAHPASDGSSAFVLGETDLQALELSTGNSRWKTVAAVAKGTPQLFHKAGVVYLSYKPTWTPLTLLAAYDAAGGDLLWSKEKPEGGYGLLPYANELLLLTRENGSKSDNVFVRAVDPRTGELQREYQATGLVGGHCFTSKGTGNFLVYSNSWYLDRTSGETTGANTVRAPCRLGQMPANGLTYFLPQHCDCQVVLRGMLAMAPASGSQRRWAASAGQIPEPTSYAAAPAPPAPQADAWPLYRRDAKRSNATPVSLPAPLHPLWSRQLGGSRLTQAVAVGDLLCTAEPRTGRVYGLDAASGQLRWTYHADGRVDFSPVLYRGLCLFGTSAGTVLALEAQSGREIWRLRAAPAEKYIVEEGRFASAWPVTGGVLPLGDDIYFNCGRAARVDGGIFLYAADAATGKVRWRIPGGTSADLFASDGQNLMLTKTFYKPRDGARILGAPKSTGLLHTTAYLTPVSVIDYMASVEPSLTSHRHVDLTDGNITGEALAFSGEFGVAAWRYRFGVPAALQKRERLNERFIYAKSGDRVQWLLDENLRQQMVSIVLAGDAVVMAGVPTSLDPRDPCELRILATADGQLRQTLPLDARPVYDGLSAAAGRLYLAAEDGRLLCFGGK